MQASAGTSDFLIFLAQAGQGASGQVKWQAAQWDSLVHLVAGYILYLLSPQGPEGLLVLYQGFGG